MTPTRQTPPLTFAPGWIVIVPDRGRAGTYRSNPTHAAERREMKTVEFLIPSAPRARQNIPQVGASDSLITLIAMAGHDLRQPLQLITSAHDVFATASYRSAIGRKTRFVLHHSDASGRAVSNEEGRVTASSAIACRGGLQHMNKNSSRRNRAVNNRYK